MREFLDEEGQPATYQDLLRRVGPHVAAELTPERFAARHAEAQAGVAYLKDAVRRAELDRHPHRDPRVRDSLENAQNSVAGAQSLARLLL